MIYDFPEPITPASRGGERNKQLLGNLNNKPLINNGNRHREWIEKP